MVANDDFRDATMSKPENVKCPKCEGPMVSRKSTYGVFWGCAAYPKCKGIRNADGESRPSPRDEDAPETDPPIAPSHRQAGNDRSRWRNQ